MAIGTEEDNTTARTSATNTFGNSALAGSGSSFLFIDHNHPLYLQPTDIPSSSLVSIQLTGSDNYALWSCAMRIGLLGKSKLGFVDGKFPKSKFEPELHDLWEKVNAVVLLWIMNAVRPGLLSSVLYESSAHKVWGDLKERFDKVNDSRVLFLHKEMHNLTQGTMTVADYFSKLRDLWDGFDALMPCSGCPCPESKLYAQHFEAHRLLQFLTGLNDSYAQSKSQIMMMTPVPTINKVYSLLADQESNPSFAAEEEHIRYETQLNTGPHHQKGFTSANPITPQMTQTQPFFTQEQYQQIVLMLSQESAEGSGSSSKIVAAGILTHVNAFVSQCINSDWIIDTGASNHMTSRFELLLVVTQTHKSLPTTKKNIVHLPNGNAMLISHICSTSVLDNQKIYNVLYIPDFKFNLLLVSQLTRELKCMVGFFPDFCIFQNLYSGQVKEIGREEHGLYVLKGGVSE
uniref:Retrotransposon Copia-like N-terminal domain-containing protein n=1 Tax=Nicotiana tabacum TaxID=4097 RepID=A0A1S4DBK6_TOBAC|nr:PREDICTED: uncharacterized protein LOC107828085 [Nicotiana tabacum]